MCQQAYLDLPVAVLLVVAALSVAADLTSVSVAADVAEEVGGCWRLRVQANRQ